MSTQTKKNTGGPGGGPGRHGFRKPKNTKKTLLRMFSYLSGNVPLLTVAFVMIILSALAGVAASYLLKPLINNLTSNLKAYIDSGLASIDARNLVIMDLGKNPCRDGCHLSDRRCWYLCIESRDGICCTKNGK